MCCRGIQSFMGSRKTAKPAVRAQETEQSASGILSHGVAFLFAPLFYHSFNSYITAKATLTLHSTLSKIL